MERFYFSYLSQFKLRLNRYYYSESLYNAVGKFQSVATVYFLI